MQQQCTQGVLLARNKQDKYINTIKEAGFVNIQIQKEREINVPNETLIQHLSSEELCDFKRRGVGIFSITVYADKP